MRYSPTFSLSEHNKHTKLHLWKYLKKKHFQMPCAFWKVNSVSIIGRESPVFLFSFRNSDLFI